MLLLLPLWALCAGALPARAQSASGNIWGVPQLMAALAQTSSATASFTERQTSPLLTTPLISTGTLTYKAPDYLRKDTTTPAPESFILQGSQVTLNGAGTGGEHVFSLTQDPRIAGLVIGIRATLAGDLPALQQAYHVSLSGSASGWQLTLVPKDAALAHFIRVLTISGAQGRITLIDTQSADGGEARTSILPADAP